MIWLHWPLPGWAIDRTPAISIQPYLDRVEQAVTEFTLDNGLKFIVLERHQAPVISFMTYADVGAADEPSGQTGVAHFLEHLAFKGTTQIGTIDYAQEQQILSELDRVFQELQALRSNQTELEPKIEPKIEPNMESNHLEPDIVSDIQVDIQVNNLQVNGPIPASNLQEDRIRSLQTEFEHLKAEAARFVEQNEFAQIIQQAGGVGLNASTSADATRYFYSLPSNKLELWMSLESERFLQPVFREFYEEKEVILEERRLRLENNPVNQLFEAVQATAFTVHPYGRPIIGYEEDIRNLQRSQVQDFFNQHYGPKNLTIAIVGDINPVTVQELAQTYFGRYPDHSAPLTPLPSVSDGQSSQTLPIEPPQIEPKEITLQLQTQPWYVAAYHSPSIQNPDGITAQLLTSILSEGRTSRLYQALVDQQQIALTVQGFQGYPGNKYPNLMMFYILPSPGHSLEEMATALEQQLEKIQREPVAELELNRIKTQARAGLLQSLRSNPGMASMLTEYEVKTGSWQNLFKELELIDRTTPEEIQKLAQMIFRPENRTIGQLLSLENSQS